MYKLIAFLLVLIAGLQYRLWLGDGGIREFRETTQRIEELKQEVEQRVIRNAAVAADVRDLRDGDEAIEERARHDLGMIKTGETFVQVYDEIERKPQTPVTDVSADPGNQARPARPPKSLKAKPRKPTGKPPASAKPRNKPR